MRLLPKDKTGRIEFCEGRLAPWAENAAEIGTTPEQVAELAALTAEAREALSAQAQAEQTARSATMRLQDAISRMSTAAGAIVLQVRSRAAIAGDTVYSLASISPPAEPSPIAAPGKPTGITAQLKPDGGLLLTWRCDNPRGSQGTIYQVYRRTDNGELKFIGGTGKKKFFDNTLPPGAAVVVYQIRAERSTRVGEWGQQIVHLGGSVHLPGVQAKNVTQWAPAA